MQSLHPVRRLLVFSLCASIASLAVAYAAQFGFGLEPCHLCLVQRAPFALVILLSLWGLTRNEPLRLLYCISAMFLAGSAVAIYHSAVEQHWVSGPSGCTLGQAPAGESSEDFLKRIQNAPVAACDQPSWEWHGVTMAALNAVWSLLLGIFVFLAARFQARRRIRA